MMPTETAAIVSVRGWALRAIILFSRAKRMASASAT